MEYCFVCLFWRSGAECVLIFVRFCMCMRKNRFPDNRNGNLPKLGANLPQFGTFLFTTWPHIGKYQFGGPWFATGHVNGHGSQATYGHWLWLFHSILDKYLEKLECFALPTSGKLEHNSIVKISPYVNYGRSYFRQDLFSRACLLGHFYCSVF